MQADIHNKLNGTRLSDRTEDNLTGNFLGTVRYLYPKADLSDLFNKIDSTNGDIQELFEKLKTQAPDNYFFWERGTEGEIDLLLENQLSSIGIEVKLDSGLSSDDDLICENDEEDRNSINQLIKYARMIMARKKIFHALIFLAPFDKKYIYDDIVNRNNTDINNLDFFGYISWEQIYRNLQNLTGNSFYEEFPYKIIINDLIELLKQKGFETFSGFYHSDIKINTNINWTFTKREN